MTVSRRAALTGLLAAGLAEPLRAADWPAAPLQWIIPFPAGGAADVFARPIAEEIAGQLGKSVVIDNRSGAGGMIAAAIAAKADPDGYTLLMGYTGHAYAPVVYPHAGVDLLRDFEPISALARAPLALVVNPAVLDVSTYAEFAAAAAKAPDRINIGSAGLGTVHHFAIDLLQARSGLKLHHVPYRGGPPALQDLLAGQIEANIQSVNLVLPYARSGKLRVLAVAARRRDPSLPDVPTSAEAGLADFRIGAWYGMFAPKGTPAAVLDRLHAVVQAALATDRIKRIWLEQGARVEPESREDFARFVALEVERWSRIARAANVTME